MDGRWWVRFPVAPGNSVDFVADRRPTVDEFDIMLEYLSISRRALEKTEAIDAALITADRRGGK